jgi:hypothetical protein
LPSVLFSRKPIIRFYSEQDHCCGQRLTVQKTRRKTFVTLNGRFIAHETVHNCPVCLHVYASKALMQMVASRCNVAYDVLVFVGKALFQRYRTAEEVRTELASRGVRLSASEINYLGSSYDRLRKRLRHHTISSRMHAIIREGQHSLRAHDYTAESLLQAFEACQNFDLPLLEFANRLIKLHRCLSELFHSGADQREHPLLNKLARLSSDIAKDTELIAAADELIWRCEIFDRLRIAMRIAPAGDSHGINDDGTTQAMSSIRHDVKQFGRELEPRLPVDALSGKMAEQIDKYGDKLFADPIEMERQFLKNYLPKSAMYHSKTLLNQRPTRIAYCRELTTLQTGYQPLDVTPGEHLRIRALLRFFSTKHNVVSNGVRSVRTFHAIRKKVEIIEKILVQGGA